MQIYRCFHPEKRNRLTPTNEDARTNVVTREQTVELPGQNLRGMKATITLLLAMCVAGVVRADQTTQSVQQALKDQGFYYGNVTGDKSAETTAAIRRYQIRNGLQVTGEINPEILNSLNVSGKSNSVSSSQASSKPAVAQSNNARPPD